MTPPQAEPRSLPPGQADSAPERPAIGAAVPGGRFRLVRYFAWTSLVAFAALGAALVYFEARDWALQDRVHRALVLQQQERARSQLLAVQQAAHVELARTLARMVWAAQLAPLLDQAARIPLGPCRAVADAPSARTAAARREPASQCDARVGERIRALPQFAALDAAVRAAMRESELLKIKVYDARGVTVYSTEPGEVGEDRQADPGWKSAAGGRPVSNVVSRGRWDLDGRLVQRDLIETYVPVGASGGKIAAVFELYSDMTRFFAEARESAAQLAAVAIENEAARRQNRSRAAALALALVALFYAVLILIVRRGERLLERRERERVRAEQERRTAEEQFHALVEQSLAGIYIIQDGKFAYVNPRAAEIYGFPSPEELIGKDPLSLVVEEDRATVAQNLARRLSGEVPALGYSFGARRRDGARIEIGVHGACVSYRGRPAIIGLMQDISEKKRAEEEIQRYIARLENSFMQAVRIATALGELRDPYTAGHERRVGEIAARIGAELGLDERRVEGLRVAGYLHDVGKIAVPAEILAKPGRLNAAEFELVKTHAQAGYELLKNVEFPWPLADIVLQHHERMDGSGYPRGHKGSEILLEARILGVADTVEAMSSHRPYRPALGLEAALSEVERGRGAAYDADVADACLRLFREKGYTIPD